MTDHRRRAGLLIPLFSAVSSTSWGIGDIGDVAPLCAWLASAGQRVLLLLPVNEMAPGNHSPYSAMSAMAIDPIYIRVPDVDEFRAAGAESSLAPEDRDAIDQARRAARVAYGAVRQVKQRALCAAFERFASEHLNRGTRREAAFRAWAADEAWWLDDYALFRAIHDRDRGAPWTTWPDALRDRRADAVRAAQVELGRDILFYQYVQWLAGTQWTAARAVARTHGVSLFGDLPFMVDTHSADVWAHQGEFQLDRSVGVPPDAFSEDGQDWGMPAYDWDAVARSGFSWLRERARRSAELYDGYRVDHLVGFYRTYSRPRSGEGEPSFNPSTEDEQRALGERVLGIFRDTGVDVIAEDLGTVPDFVRASLATLEMPGYRVLRWEREWDESDQPFRDPADYPEASVATTGTHDTEPLVVWWEGADKKERAAVAAIPSIASAIGDVDLVEAPFAPVVRDALLETLVASGSDYVLFPVQDVFGWSERINEPATVSDDNWTYRLPWLVDRMDSEPLARERQRMLKLWADRYRRTR